MSMPPGSHLPCDAPAHSLWPMTWLESWPRWRRIAATPRTYALYYGGDQPSVTLFSASIPIVTWFALSRGSPAHEPLPAW